MRTLISRLLIKTALFVAATLPGICSALPPGHYWRFERNFRDSGSPRNDLIGFGSPQFSEDALGVAAGSRALFLSGSAGQRLQKQQPIQFASDEPWSVSWWARRASLGDSKGMVVGKAGTAGDFIWLNDSQRGLRFRNSSATTFDFYAPKDSGLRHYVLVADGNGGLALFLDGEKSEELSGNTSFEMDSVGEAFPTASSNFNFHGWLDELRVFPAALTDAEVAALHGQGPERAPATPERVAVVLLGGQSNAEGHGPANDLPHEAFFPQEDVDFFYHFPGGPFELATVRPGVSRRGSFGPEIALGRRLADLVAGDGITRVAVIKYARGGTNLHTQWRADGTELSNNDGPEYQAFQESVHRGLVALAERYPDSVIDLVGMAWMQGEADRSPPFNGVYEENLRRLIADVRATFGDRLPFVVGRLSTNQTAMNANDVAVVRAAQTAVADEDPLVGLVDTDDFSVLPDVLHFDAEGLLRMGREFAERLAYLHWAKSELPENVIDAGGGAPSSLYSEGTATNFEHFVFDWPRGDGEIATLRRVGGIALDATGAGNFQLRFLASPRRILTIERYAHETRQWLAEGEPFRSSNPVETIAVSATERSAMFRLRSSLPESPF